MKIFIFLCLLCIICFWAPGVYAQDSFFGFGAEVNGNASKGMAAGGGWSFGLGLNRYISLGFKTTFSYNLDKISNMEQCGLLRFYLPLKTQGPFLQTEAGGSVFFTNKNSEFFFLGGVSMGWQIVIKKSWYVEPVARFGYPFIWGAGLNMGCKFQINKE